LHIQFSPGLVFKIPAMGDDFAYGLMLNLSPYVAFYGRDVHFSNSGLPVDSPIFIVAVMKSAYSVGGWGSPIGRVSAGDIPPVPSYFRQDSIEQSYCRIIEASGREVVVAAQECVGLERDAVWSAEHIASRISDFYAGRPNRYVRPVRLEA
jgi:hypothetical protein